MCNQAVSLVAAELERRGIATVAIVLLRGVAERVRPPRALAVPFRHGYPLGEPGRPDRQRWVMEHALGLVEAPGVSPPTLVDLPADPSAAPPRRGGARS